MQQLQRCGHAGLIRDAFVANTSAAVTHTATAAQSDRGLTLKSYARNMGEPLAARGDLRIVYHEWCGLLNASVSTWSDP